MCEAFGDALDPIDFFLPATVFNLVEGPLPLASCGVGAAPHSHGLLGGAPQVTRCGEW